MTRLNYALLAAGILLAAVPQTAQSPARWPTYRISEAPPELRPQIQRADLVVISLQDTMLAELSRDLEQGGPALAVRSCHLDTTSAAYRLARHEGIEAGRTSDRLRVPTNMPKPWAASIVAEVPTLVPNDMFATAGRFACSVTQSIPLMIVEVDVLPAQSNTRTE